MGMIVFLYFGEKLKYKIISVISTIIAALFILFLQNPITDIIAYILGIVLIYIYVSNSIPSIAVILAAVSDIIITLAVVNLLGIKLSTAGIAAFLMLIGYSVDTDILLSTKVLKRKEGEIIDRVLIAFKTGIVMSITTITAVSLALIFTQSEIIKQIMMILLIGLLVDIINTWIQNVGILRWHLEKKQKIKNE
jgi:preprotein translocase subunit SecF